MMLKKRKRLLWAVMLLAITWLAGCGTAAEPSENPNNSNNNVPMAANQEPTKEDNEPVGNGFIGYVVKKEDNRILVVESKLQDFSSHGGIGHYYAATWFGNAPDDVEVGHQVEVWADGGINESYPGQGSAKKVNMIESDSNRYEGALLTEAEVIRKALAAEEVTDIFTPAIVAVTFDPDLALWTVQIDHTGEGHEPILIEVSDQK